MSDTVEQQQDNSAQQPDTGDGKGPASRTRDLLLGAGVGYLLCLWLMFFASPPMPRLAPPPHPDLVDRAGPGLNPAVARKLTQDLFRPYAPCAGEVRTRIDRCAVTQTIDFNATSPDDPDSWARKAGIALWGKSRAVLRDNPVYTMASLFPQPKAGTRAPNPAPPGHLSARFESGPDGAASVGHTPSAGTSYGTFQIASGTPTFNNFLRFLKDRAPDLHYRLAGSGPANTGSTVGTVPEEWRRIAREQPARFERLQYDFILATHYRPAVAEILGLTGLDVSALSPASREVLLSSAVQHGVGGAAMIFVSAVNVLKNRILYEKNMGLLEQALIEEVYRQRLRVWGQSPLVSRDAMLSRYGREKSHALGMLERHYSGTLPSSGT